MEVHGQWNQNGEATPLTAEKVRSAAKAGLAAAATNAKLIADHEEREIQRLSANIINHQVYLLGCSYFVKTLMIHYLMLFLILVFSMNSQFF